MRVFCIAGTEFILTGSWRIWQQNLWYARIFPPTQDSSCIIVIPDNHAIQPSTSRLLSSVKIILETIIFNTKGIKWQYQRMMKTHSRTIRMQKLTKFILLQESVGIIMTNSYWEFRFKINHWLTVRGFNILFLPFSVQEARILMVPWMLLIKFNHAESFFQNAYFRIFIG